MKLLRIYFLLALTLISMQGCHRRLPTWELLNPQEPTNVTDAGDYEALRQALDHELNYLELQVGKNPLQTATIGEQQIRHSALLAAYSRFAEWLKDNPTPQGLSDYLKEHFDFYRLNTPADDQGVLVTSYYVPEYAASRQCNEEYAVPLLPVPADLDPSRPYYTRSQINEDGVLNGRVEPLACLQYPIDRLMLQVQGSGRLLFPDKSQTIIGYAANNGHPFVGLGNLLIRDNLLPPTERNMQGIRNYFINHPEELTRYERQMPRYIFFTFKEEAVGTLQLPVVPLRTIAVDPNEIPFGLLLHLRTRRPVLDDNNQYQGTTPLEGLAFSHDTGSAIVGDHIDLFWGFGAAAGEFAGRMKERGSLIAVVPKSP